MDRQSLPVRPEIFERLVVVQLDIRVHDFLNWVRHGFPDVIDRVRLVALAGFKIVSSARRNGFVPHRRRAVRKNPVREGEQRTLAAAHGRVLRRAGTRHHKTFMT